MKINKETYDALPASLKASFNVNPANPDEYDNGEESATGLKTALQKEKEEAAGIKAKLATFEAEKAKEIEAARKKALEDARSTGDFAAIEKDYQRQLKEAKDALAAKEAEATERLKQDAVNKEIEGLAKMFVSPALAKTFIKERLTAEIVEGQPIVRVLSKDGKASALSVEDLKKEFLTDGELKSSLIATKGAGGGSGAPTAGGGSGAVVDDKFDAANAKPADLIARLEAKGVVGGEED
jgi:hypothetical protein